MKKTLLSLVFILAAPFAMAETTTYKVSGMHCAGCTGMAKAEVCKIEGIDKCNVSVGKIVITPKANASVSKAQVQTALTKAGEFSITETTVTK